MGSARRKDTQSVPHMKSYLALLIAVALLSACSGLFVKPEPPQVSLAAVSLLDANLLEQRFMLRLRIQNPNGFSLPVNALTYALEINDTAFVKGQSNHAVTVPKFGSEFLDVEAISNLAGIARQLKDLLAAMRTNVRYRLIGTAYLGTNDRRVPFEQAGEIDLPALFSQ